MITRRAGLLALGAGAAYVITGARRAQAQTVTMRYSVGNPVTENHFGWTPHEVMRREIEARSGGQIRVQLFPGGQLGSIESTVNQTRDGILQAADPADGPIAAFFPEIQLFSLPYLFASREIAWAVLDGPFGEAMRDRMAQKTGLRPLFWLENGGYRHFTSTNRPMRTVADLQGLRMRVQNLPMHLEMVRNLGMSPTPIPWGELYTSLQTGVADGQENSIPTFITPRLFEVQRHMILDGHVYAVQTVVVNERWFQGLTAQQRAAISQAASVARTANRGLAVANEISGRAMLEQRGMTIVDPGPQVRAEFRQRTQPAALAWARGQIDAGLVDQLMSAVAEAEARLGHR